MFFIFLIAIFLGGYILIIDPKNKTHRMFFLLAINMALWNLFAALAFSSSTEKQLWLFFRIGAVFEIIFVSLMFHFIIILTHSRINTLIILTIYALSLPVHYKNWSSFFVFDRAKRESNIWVLHPAFHSFWMHYWTIYFEFILVISLILLLRQLKRAKTQRGKQQARIFFYSFLVYVVACIIGDYFLSPHFKIPPLSPSYLILFLIGISYSIAKYRFMNLTQVTVSKDILENMDELIILFDTNIELVKANRKTFKYFGHSPSKMIGKNPSDLFGNVAICFQKVLSGQQEIATCLVKVEFPTPRTTVLEIHLSPVKDKHEKITGILLRGKETPGATQFIERFHISNREWETIQYLNIGITNREIARYMNISERTVKAHIAHIYNKLGIKNKFELVNTLRGFSISFRN